MKRRLLFTILISLVYYPIQASANYGQLIVEFFNQTKHMCTLIEKETDYNAISLEDDTITIGKSCYIAFSKKKSLFKKRLPALHTLLTYQCDNQFISFDITTNHIDAWHLYGKISGKIISHDVGINAEIKEKQIFRPGGHYLAWVIYESNN